MIKALFPEGVETLTISKNDYDRLYGELTYKNIILQQKVEQLEKGIEDYIEELSWVNSTEEELKNVKIINRLKKIIKGSENNA